MNTFENTLTKALMLLILIGANACSRRADLDLHVVEPCVSSAASSASSSSYRFNLHRYQHQENLAELGERLEGSAFSPSDELSGVSFDVDEKVVASFEGFSGPQSSASISSLAAVGPLDASLHDGEVTLTLGRANGFERTTRRVSSSGESECSDLRLGETRNESGDDILLSRFGHSTTYLPSIEKVLIMGGAEWVDNPGANADDAGCKEFSSSSGMRVKCMVATNRGLLFDPVSSTYEIIGAELGIHSRVFHQATLTRTQEGDAVVVISGGFGVLSEDAGGFQALQSGVAIRVETLLDDDPEMVNIALSAPRAMHSAHVLPGRNEVILVGGCAGPGCSIDGVETFNGVDPTTGAGVGIAGSFPVLESVHVSFAEGSLLQGEIVGLSDGDSLALARSHHAASVIGDVIVISGGVNAGGLRDGLEVVGMMAGANSLVRRTADAERTSDLSFPGRIHHQQITIGGATRGANGRRTEIIAIIGGYDDIGNASQPRSGDVPTGDISFHGITTPADSDLTSISLVSARAGHRVVRLYGDDLLVFGGTLADPINGLRAEIIRRENDGSYSNQNVSAPPRQALSGVGSIWLPSNLVVTFGGYDPVEGTTLAQSETFFGYRANL